MPATIKGAYVDDTVKFEEGRRITVGIGTVIVGDVKIGQGTAISFNCSITAREHNTTKHQPIRFLGLYNGKIDIGEDVWIGAGAIILPDVVIERGAVIGAGSVVVKHTHISAYEIWAGNPAKFIKIRKTCE